MVDRVASEFVESASPRMLSLMQALAVAESLTDDVARQVLEMQGVTAERAPKFVELLHCTDCVVPRNSEWHFSSEVRAALRRSARDGQVKLEAVHQLLLQIGRTGNRADAGDRIPAYLFTVAGAAYHTGALGYTRESLNQYARAADVPDNGELWLAGALSQEQQHDGTLPADAIEPAFLRALSAYRDKDEERAYPELIRVAASGQRNELVAWALQLAGEIETRRGELRAAWLHLDESIELFEALKSWNKCVWALAARAEVLRQLKLPDLALEDLRRAASLCVGDWRALLLCRVAVIEHEQHRLGLALAALDQAEERAERVLAQVLVQRVGLLRESGRWTEALAVADRAVNTARGGRKSFVLNTRASVYWDLGRWTAALTDLDDAYRMAAPENLAVVLNTRSCVKRDLGDFDGVLADDQALMGLPSRWRRSLRWEEVLERSKKARAASERLSRAGAEEQTNGFWFRHFLSMAQIATRGRAWYRAVELMKRALANAQTDAQRAKCLRGIGVAYEKTLEDKALAVEPLMGAIAIEPDDGVALATLGRVLDVLGEPLEAVESYFLRAVTADPDNKWARSWYALALSRAGRHDEALALAEGAISDPPNPVLLFNLAVVLGASPRAAERHRALDVARQAAAGAEPGFDAPARFLEERGSSRAGG